MKCCASKTLPEIACPCAYNDYLNGSDITLGFIATLSLVSCTQASNTTSSNGVTSSSATASQRTPRSERTIPLSSSTDVGTQSQESAVSTSGEPVQLRSEEAGSRIDVRSEPSKSATSLYSGQVGDKGRAFDMTRDSNGQMWYKVRLESGVEGWVLGQFIEVNYGIDSPKSPAVVMGRTWIVAQPKNDAPHIEEIQGGGVVEVSMMGLGSRWKRVGSMAKLCFIQPAKTQAIEDFRQPSKSKGALRLTWLHSRERTARNT